MIGTVPAELVWFVDEDSAAYDVLLYRAMAAEYKLSEALCGDPGDAGMWLSERHYEHRWAPFERAVLALGV